MQPHIASLLPPIATGMKSTVGHSLQVHVFLTVSQRHSLGLRSLSLTFCSPPSTSTSSLRRRTFPSLTVTSDFCSVLLWRNSDKLRSSGKQCFYTRLCIKRK
ncbi:hypothetical protein I3843_13G106900 [Carya illinoinensis]|nr:hypothetical protein I3843_13G106900 [Carya illinoinensis]